MSTTRTHQSTENVELSGSRMVALIVAAVALSIAAALLVSGPRQEVVAVPGGDAGVDDPAPAEEEPPPAAEPRTADRVAADPTSLPAIIGDRAPGTVDLELTTTEVEGQMADGSTYTYWTFDNQVPGPMLRVRVGDTVNLTLNNDAASKNPHSIDLHAVTGPGGGAEVLQVPPGESKSLTFKALKPGVYVYHCATPHVPSHIAQGMYGLIVVEPEGGMPAVDKEFYIVQGDFYTTTPKGTPGLHEFDYEAMGNEQPTYVVFNGQANALTGDHAMQAEVGDRVRMFVGNGGPNKISSFHIIGEIFDVVHPEGATEAQTNVQTTLIPSGGATWVEFTVDYPGNYILVDHAITRAIDKGAVGILQVSGPADPSIFEGHES